MAVGAALRNKINSIKKTQKITGAMQLVAASKMRKAQERMELSKPYSREIRKVINHIAESTSEYRHPYLVQREEIKRVGYIIVSTDRGLCGSLNINVFKSAILSIKEWQQKSVEIDLCSLGVKAEMFFKRTGGNIVAKGSHLGDAPTVADLIGMVKIMLDKYENGELDAIYLVSNEFINTMTQKPYVQQLLPLEPEEGEGEGEKNQVWDYIYEPEAKQLLDLLLVRYIETQVYQAVIENIACEQGARMVAMKSATDNAGDLIDELQLVYNKARQAAITQEIAEICSGAESV